VTVLIYDQTCAAEKRRRRKHGKLVDPDRGLFINELVCEGCGDCSVQSNCVAVLPLETEFGRKRKIDQSACNKDYSCAKGFCPSFVGVRGGRLRKKVGALASAGSPGAEDFHRRVAALPVPAPHTWTGPYDLLVTGVGGTGVVTVGALIAMASDTLITSHVPMIIPSPSPVRPPETALTSNGPSAFMPTPIWVILDFMESLSRYLSNASGLISKFISSQRESSKQDSVIAETELGPWAL